MRGISTKYTNLIEGDCLDFLKDFTVQVDAIMIDPPYEVLNKKASWDKAIDPVKLFPLLYKVRKSSSTPIIIFSQEPYTSQLILNNKKDFKYKLYWHKTAATGFLNAKKQPLRNIEEICVFYSKQCTYNAQKTQGHTPVHSFTKRVEVANSTDCYGETSKEVKGGGNTDRYPTQLLTFKSDKQTCNLHPTQKPVALMEWLIKTYTNEGDTVLDCTAGSFTTGVACLRTGRKFIGVEKEPKYFDIGVSRIAKEERELNLC